MMRRAILLLLFCALSALPALAAEKQSHAYMRQVLSGKKGLLAMAEVEATTALLQARLALKKPEDLAWMREHAHAVVYATDPSKSKNKAGPGKGYGVVKAAENIEKYIRAAGKSKDASEKVKSYSRRVATSPKNVNAWAVRAADLAGKVTNMKTTRNAVRVLLQIRQMCQQMLLGKDSNRDGKVTWKRHEGGLLQARRYMELMQKAEKIE